MYELARQPADVQPTLDGERMLVAEASADAYVADLGGRARFRVRPAGERDTHGPYLYPAHFFSPDGRWIVGGAFDGARLWPAAEKELIGVARGRAERLGRDRDLRGHSEFLGQTAAD